MQSRQFHALIRESLTSPLRLARVQLRSWLDEPPALFGKLDDPTRAAQQAGKAPSPSPRAWVRCYS